LAPRAAGADSASHDFRPGPVIRREAATRRDGLRPSRRPRHGDRSARWAVPAAPRSARAPRPGRRRPTGRGQRPRRSAPTPPPARTRAEQRCGRDIRPVDGSADTPCRNHGRQRAVRILGNVAPERTAAFFDLDKTIIAKSSVLAFGKPFYQGGLINRRAVLRSAYAQFVFALAGADEDQIERMRAYLTSMCTGWDVAQVREIVSETLHEIIDPIVYDEAVELIAEHKAEGHEVVILSASGAEVVAPIADMVGADSIIATEMVVADGKYTGEIARY